jgi:TonB family protein
MTGKATQPCRRGVPGHAAAFVARMNPTIYSGYTLRREGLSVWPRRQLAWKWAALTGIRSSFAARGEGIDTVLVFNDGRSLVLRGVRFFSFGTGPGRFAEIIAQAVAAAPAEAVIDELTFEVAQRGPREMRRRFCAPIGRKETPEELLGRARHHRVWLEPRRALRLMEDALQLEPDHAGALQWRYRLLMERGDAKRGRQASAEWLMRRPQDPQAQAAVFSMRLVQNEREAAPEAARFLEKNAGHDELAADLAAYHFRAGDYPQAAECWGRLAQTAKDPALRQQAQGLQQHAERTGRDNSFRWREKILHWGKLVLVWTIVTGALVIQGVRFYALFTRKEREQERQRQAEATQRQWAEEMKQRQAASDRQFTELTGRVMGDYAAARARADQGEAAAQLTVAEMLFDGAKGAPKDPAAGLEYLEKAAAQGHRAALLSLGQNLVSGKRLPADAARAARLFEQAMEKDSPRAAAELAELYQKGAGVEQDKARAFALYAKAAEGGYVYAMSQAGWMLERGDAGSPDLKRAQDYYRQAAEKNSLWAQERLVHLLSAGKTVDTDLAEAAKWTEAGAAGGSIVLQLRLASDLAKGVEMSAEKKAKIVGWLKKSVDLNKPGAATALGSLSAYGLSGSADFNQAIRWWQQDAVLGHSPAQMVLVRCYAFGVGVERSLARANELRAGIKASAQQARWLDEMLAAAARPLVWSAETDMAPQPIWQDQPTYPPALAQAGISGEARMEFWLDEEGFTRNVRVITASHEQFGLAAWAAVAGWRFQPRITAGKAQFGPMLQTVEFHLVDQ